MFPLQLSVIAVDVITTAVGAWIVLDSEVCIAEDNEGLRMDRVAWRSHLHLLWTIRAQRFVYRSSISSERRYLV